MASWLGTSVWSYQKVLGVAVVLGEGCRVASNGAWKICKSGEMLPGTATLLMSIFQCVFGFAFDCTKLKILLAFPLELLSSDHASRAPLLLAALRFLVQLHCVLLAAVR